MGGRKIAAILFVLAAVLLYLLWKVYVWEQPRRYREIRVLPDTLFLNPDKLFTAWPEDKEIQCFFFDNNQPILFQLASNPFVDEYSERGLLKISQEKTPYTYFLATLLAHNGWNPQTGKFTPSPDFQDFPFLSHRLYGSLRNKRLSYYRGIFLLQAGDTVVPLALPKRSYHLFEYGVTTAQGQEQVLVYENVMEGKHYGKLVALQTPEGMLEVITSTNNPKVQETPSFFVIRSGSEGFYVYRKNPLVAEREESVTPPEPVLKQPPLEAPRSDRPKAPQKTFPTSSQIPPKPTAPPPKSTKRKMKIRVTMKRPKSFISPKPVPDNDPMESTEAPYNFFDIPYTLQAKNYLKSYLHLLHPGLIAFLDSVNARTEAAMNTPEEQEYLNYFEETRRELFKREDVLSYSNLFYFVGSKSGTKYFKKNSFIIESHVRTEDGRRVPICLTKFGLYYAEVLPAFFVKLPLVDGHAQWNSYAFLREGNSIKSYRFSDLYVETLASLVPRKISLFIRHSRYYDKYLSPPPNLVIDSISGTKDNLAIKVALLDYDKDKNETLLFMKEGEVPVLYKAFEKIAPSLLNTVPRAYRDSVKRYNSLFHQAIAREKNRRLKYHRKVQYYYFLQAIASAEQWKEEEVIIPNPNLLGQLIGILTSPRVQQGIDENNYYASQLSSFSNYIQFDTEIHQVMSDLDALLDSFLVYEYRVNERNAIIKSIKEENRKIRSINKLDIFADENKRSERKLAYLKEVKFSEAIVQHSLYLKILLLKRVYMQLLSSVEIESITRVELREEFLQKYRASGSKVQLKIIQNSSDFLIELLRVKRKIREK